KNTTEAMLHSYRAIEGLLYWWAADYFPDYVREQEIGGYPLISDSILQKHPSLQRHFNTPEHSREVNLQGRLLKDLLNATIPETVTSIDFQSFWNSAYKLEGVGGRRLCPLIPLLRLRRCRLLPLPFPIPRHRRRH
ncbi:MAG: hypothetical protein ACKPB9_35065, partial [Dolichospermum sp.]